MSDINVSFIDVPLDNPCRIPYWEVQSGRPGPCVLVTAAMHGNEVQGSEVVRRFAADHAHQLTRGSCLLVPFANPPAMQRHHPHIGFEPGRYYGNDTQNNINLTWPGDANGNQTQRLADMLFKTLVPDATHLIDFHCWAAAATTVLVRTDHRASVELAKASNFRFLRASAPSTAPRDQPTFPCTLNDYFVDTGRSAITLEFDGQYVIKEHEVADGLRCLQNCLHHLDMLPSTSQAADQPQIWLEKTQRTEVLTPCQGLFVQAPDIRTSQYVSEGQKLGHVLRDDNLETVDISAPASGYLYVLGRRDPARKGDEFEMRYYHPYVRAESTVAVIVS